ncbi:unnamed protein product, partial [Adineta steineri]
MDVWWVLLILIVRTVAEKSESKFMNSGAGLEVKSAKLGVESKKKNDDYMDKTVKKQN